MYSLIDALSHLTSLPDEALGVELAQRRSATRFRRQTSPTGAAGSGPGRSGCSAPPPTGSARCGTPPG